MRLLLHSVACSGVVRFAIDFNLAEQIPERAIQASA
jgi:hypothetical protein